jgi:hypothetical protein
MGLSWTKSVADFKSPLRVVTQVLWRSRRSKVRKCQRLKRDLDEARWAIARKDARLQRQHEQICGLRRQLPRAEIEKQIQARASSSVVRAWPIHEEGWEREILRTEVEDVFEGCW